MAILIGTRTTRRLVQELDLLALDAARCRELADQGVGLVVWGLPIEDNLPRLVRIASNAAPDQTVVAAYSYELARDLADACHERHLRYGLIDRHRRKWPKDEVPHVILTVPERLRELQPMVAKNVVTPTLMLLLDPQGRCCAGRDSGGLDSSRAANIGCFRGYCLAKGQSPFVLYVTGVPPMSLFIDRLTVALNVETCWYVKGLSLRTAGVDQTSLTAVPGSNEQHWLSRHVAAAHELPTRLVLMAGGPYERRREEAQRFAACLQVPAVDMMAVLGRCQDPGDRMHCVGMELRRALDVINKQVVVLERFGECCSALATPVVIDSIRAARSDSILVASGPFDDDLTYLGQAVPIVDYEIAQVPES